jgi:two-component system OmpR family response regulator
MNVLLIEDDAETADQVAHVLKSQGHDVDVCEDGLSGAVFARSCNYAALVVDRMLPGCDGLSLVKGLRDEGYETPILLITALSGIDDRVEGLESGADDYLSKPFALSELLARVNAIARRCGRNDQEPTVLKFGGLEVNLIRRTLIRDGVQIGLGALEFSLLAYLMRNANNVATRAMLLENVWDLHFEPGTNIVETHISRLRSKLGSGVSIRNIREVGYSLRLC